MPGRLSGSNTFLHFEQVEFADARLSCPILDPPSSRSPSSVMPPIDRRFSFATYRLRVRAGIPNSSATFVVLWPPRAICTARRMVERCGSTFHFIFRLLDFAFGVLGGDDSDGPAPESPDSPAAADEVSRLATFAGAVDAMVDVGIKVGEFGEEAPRRETEEESRRVLVMVVDRAVTEFGAIVEVEVERNEPVGLGKEIGFDIGVRTTCGIGADIVGGIVGGPVLGAVMDVDKHCDMVEHTDCLGKGDRRIREKGFGRAAPGRRSGVVEGMDGGRDKPFEVGIG